MSSLLNPYLNFNNKAKEAMEFYKDIFGGNLELNTYKESGMSNNPNEDNKIMHAMLTSENGMVLMASDAPVGMEPTVGNNVSISLSGNNETQLRGYWNKLSDGAHVDMPLEKAPWGDIFGMLTDKFGIRWMVNISEK